MKPSLMHFTLIICSAFTFSCTQEKAEQKETNVEPVQIDEPQIQSTTINNPHSEVSREKLAKECEEYWAQWEKLNAAKSEYFEKNVLAKALNNPELSEENRRFLLALKEYLHQSPADEREILAPDQLLFPIFKISEGELGIIGFPKYDTSNDSFEDISAEKSLLGRHQIVTAADPHAETKVVFHKTLADSLFNHLNKQIYTFTAQKPVKTQLQNFGTYTGECLEYYNYQLDPKPFNSNDRVLFGSKYNLELIYKNYPEIDAALKNQLKPYCADCPSSIELEKTFASIKGVNGLYFIYGDTFPLNNKLDTPSRGLVMKMDDRFIYLWHEMVDLVGCSCI